MGGDPVHGIGFVEALELFQADAETELIVLTGEIGGDDEERAAAVIAERVTKPVVGYLAGFEAPPGKRMGHAGAIVTGSSGTAAAKAEALGPWVRPSGAIPRRWQTWWRSAWGDRGRPPDVRGARRRRGDRPAGRRGRTFAFVTLIAVGQLLAGLGALLIGVYGLWSWVKIGLLTALLSLRADVLATVEGPPILRTAADSTTMQARFVPMALTIGFLWLAARAGRRAAQVGAARSALAAAGLAAAGAAVPVAVLTAACATLGTLSFPSFGLRIEVDTVGTALWAGIAARPAGAGAYLEAASGRPSAAALRVASRRTAGRSACSRCRSSSSRHSNRP